MQNRWILVGTIGRMGKPQVNSRGNTWFLIDLDVPSTFKGVERINRIKLLASGEVAEEFRRDFAEGDTVSASGIARSRKRMGEVRGEYRVTELIVQKMQLAISANIGIYVGHVIEIGEVEKIGEKGQTQWMDVLLSCWTPQAGGKREQGEVQVRIFGDWATFWQGRLKKDMLVSCTARMQSFELASGTVGVMLVVEHMEILRKLAWEEPA